MNAGPSAASESDAAAALAEEARRLRLLRMVVDFTSNVLMQARLPPDEAQALVAAARCRILELFPDKQATYELILAPRFARLLHEFSGSPDGPCRVLPFRSLRA